VWPLQWLGSPWANPVSWLTGARCCAQVAFCGRVEDLWGGQARALCRAAHAGAGPFPQPGRPQVLVSPAGGTSAAVLCCRSCWLAPSLPSPFCLCCGSLSSSVPLPPLWGACCDPAVELCAGARRRTTLRMACTTTGAWAASSRLSRCSPRSPARSANPRPPCSIDPRVAPFFLRRLSQARVWPGPRLRSLSLSACGRVADGVCACGVWQEDWVDSLVNAPTVEQQHELW
jgi:hypothetical protein